MAMDVRMFTVGPVQENTFLFRREGSDRALIVDPGEEAPRLLAAIEELGVTLDGILLTHTHFDHVGRGRADRQGNRRRGLGAGAREAGAGGHQRVRARGRTSGRSRTGTPSTPSAGASGWSWRGSRSTWCSRPATAPAT